TEPTISKTDFGQLSCSTEAFQPLVLWSQRKRRFRFKCRKRPVDGGPLRKTRQVNSINRCVREGAPAARNSTCAAASWRLAGAGRTIGMKFQPLARPLSWQVRAPRPQPRDEYA